MNQHSAAPWGPNVLTITNISGPSSTTATAELLAMSQPSISRRYRSLARDLGLERQSGAPVGRRFADAPWITLLRRGINHHRLARGVLRIGINPHQDAAFAEVPWAQCIRLGRQQRTHWRTLLATAERGRGTAVERTVAWSETP